MEENILYTDAVELLQNLIEIPSISREENQTASELCRFLAVHQIKHSRIENNVWAANRYFDAHKPTILLNSHHDTVKPNPAYTRDPFTASTENGKLYGLGSNDAGGAAVSLLAAFRYFYEKKDLKYNLIVAITAEEEISGRNGIESILSHLPENIDFAIVGEPTLTRVAIAEKGLMVLDGTAFGKPGHAAREEGINAIYEVLEDIEWFKSYRFDKISDTLGPIKMTVSAIHGGKQHNVVPAECQYVVDVRITDKYTHEEVLETIQKHIKSEVKPRSVRLRSSGIDKDHPIVRAASQLGKDLYGSPTMSDQALIPYPSIKVGPGDSARSHSADEYIELKEIKEGIETYIGLLEAVL